MIELADIEAARQRIDGKVRITPVDESESLTARCGVPVHLKLEHRQLTGAFKLRGAMNAVAKLNAEERARGVVAASTGNHGRALAYAAAQSGVRAIIAMSALVPQNKVAAIRALGADVRIIGQSQDDAQEEVERLIREEGVVSVPPFDHADIIAGQGTIGLEIVEQVPDAALVLVPLSGGGLISGVAAAIKALRPDVRVVGVSMQRGAAMAASLAARQPVAVEELATLADSLGGGIGLANLHTFEMTRQLVDDVVLLTEAEIAAGIRHAYLEEREVVEGAGAVGIAALLAGKVTSRGPIVVLMSGRNIDMALHQRIVAGANALEEAV
ncbi:hydroxyectoine utilization dehydratase EutB [Aureimonas fodinaquatilis]|uniref:Hydroxyectoine utilization dehydratase EutB n=1 Tax=Aureimonas fodinaquatilis TaxID=2565783 RepID=A0A5B0DQR1_9HYPH|nr:hydroxyectoine utilization dehydratase EutB [Aureimonas fodinaquatilis]KAA0968101.1 hydroxyectoine utilization dehydratase EutB [Aureimonas fodinaquatilis]